MTTPRVVPGSLPRMLLGLDLSKLVEEGGRTSADLLARQGLAIKSVVCRSDSAGELLAQLHNEYEITRQFTHPALRRSLQFQQRPLARGVMVQGLLLMEAVEGSPLSQRTPQDLGLLVDCFVQVAEGLAQLHDLGYAHGHLNPGNIVINANGRAKIIDFARAGRSDGNQGPRQDLACLGAILYWALTGRTVGPLAGGAAAPVPDSHDAPLLAPAQVDPSIPAALSQLAMECLRPACCRPALTAGEVARRLQEVRQTLGDHRARAALA